VLHKLVQLTVAALPALQVHQVVANLWQKSEPRFAFLKCCWRCHRQRQKKHRHVLRPKWYRQLQWQALN
jgi:hypothetical protein